MRGQFQASEQYFLRASRLAESIGDARGLGYALKGAGEAASNIGKHAVAFRFISQGASLLDRHGGNAGAGYAHKALGDAMRRMGWIDGADWEYDVANELFSKAGDPRGAAYVEDARGDCALARGDSASALQHYTRALIEFRSLEVESGAAITSRSLQRLGVPLSNFGVQRGRRSSLRIGEDMTPVRMAYKAFPSRSGGDPV